MRAILSFAMLIVATLATDVDDFVERQLKIVAENEKQRLSAEMMEAADQEVFWQLYKNWRLRLPEHQKDQIKAVAIHDTAVWIQQAVEMYMVTFDKWIHSVADPIKQALWFKWQTEGPPRTSSIRLKDIQATILEIEQEIQRIQNYVHTKDQKKYYTEQSKQVVRNYFAMHFHEDGHNGAYDVKISDFISDHMTLYPGISKKVIDGETSVPDVEHIGNQHGDNWYPVSNEEFQQKVDAHHFPVKAAVPALMMLNSQQAVPVQVLIIWADSF